MTPHLELLHEAPTVTGRKAPSLLFVHGAFCGAWCWESRFMPWFAARGFDCWAVSLEGHAGSEGRNYLSAVSIEDYRRNLSAVVKHLKAPPVMIGHSMGGYVIQQYLSHAALPGAAFLASAPPSGMATSTFRLMTQTPELFVKLNMYQHGHCDSDFMELRSLLFSDDAPDDALETVISRCQTESQRAVMDMALINPLAIRPMHPVPALVLGAADDKLIAPSDIVATAQRLDVIAEILPHMGHMMMMDTRWEQTAQRLLTWLETL
jgi:non-heme chloroperoxidase